MSLSEFGVINTSSAIALLIIAFLHSAAPALAQTTPTAAVVKTSRWISALTAMGRQPSYRDELPPQARKEFF
jgi:hypothetical protein